MIELRVIPIRGVGLVSEGDDLVTLFLDALLAQGETLSHHDLIVVTSKVVSKSEGQVVAFDGTEEHRSRSSNRRQRESCDGAGRCASRRLVTDSSTPTPGSISPIPPTARPCCYPRIPTVRRGDFAAKFRGAARSTWPS